MTHSSRRRTAARVQKVVRAMCSACCPPRDPRRTEPRQEAHPRQAPGVVRRHLLPAAALPPPLRRCMLRRPAATLLSPFLPPCSGFQLARVHRGAHSCGYLHSGSSGARRAARGCLSARRRECRRAAAGRCSTLSRVGAFAAAQLSVLRLVAGGGCGGGAGAACPNRQH